VFGGKIHVIKTVDNTKEFRKAVREAIDKRVLVGIPEKGSARNTQATAKRMKIKGRINNAQLCYIHTHGSPMHGIPARPIIEPALEAADNKARTAMILGNAARALFKAQPAQAKLHLHQAGLFASSAVKRWFTDSRNNWAPNAPSVAAHKRKNKPGVIRPLIDTGQLRNAITYVVLDKGAMHD